MHQTYFASFDLGLDETKAPDLESAVLPLVDEWLFRTRQFDRPTDFSLTDDGEYLLSDNSSIQIRVAADATGKKIHGIRFEHPDNEYRRWISDVVIVNEGSSRSRFSIRTYVRSQGAITRPIRVPVARPRLVRRLVDAVGAREGVPITSRFLRIGTGEFDQFWQFLTAHERILPIVFVSCAIDSNAPLVDPGRLADRLSGIAHVCLAMDVGVSDWLATRLPRELNTFDGAVRVYWPRLSPASNPYSMPLWTRDKLLQLRAQSPSRIIGDVMQRVADAALGRHIEIETRWDEVEQAVARARLAQSRSIGQVSDAWELADQLVKAAELKVRETAEAAEKYQERISELQTDIARSESGENHWRSRAEALERQLQVSRNETRAGRPQDGQRTVSNALRLIASKYPDRIQIEWSKVQEKECDQYEDVAKVNLALEWIANIFYFAKKGWLPNLDLPLSALRSCEFQYSANQSEITMGQYSSDYSVRVGEEIRFIKPHLKRGTSTQPKHSLRIAFDYIEEYDRILIAYVGQHQRTRNSN